jgi:hypothetical protein
MNLDLSGLIVVTECASGIYACTPVIAALAGAAKVVAFGKDSFYGTFKNAQDDVQCLWKALNLPQDACIVTDSLEVLDESLHKADIVTNSGHLRPLNAEKVKKMKKGSAIPLMYESWEFRNTDLCLKTCQECGIPVAGTNERHPDIAAFDYLGPLVAKCLFNAGLEIYGNTILLVCDNDFAPYIKKTLKNIGANILKNTYVGNIDLDAIIFAHTPATSGGKFNIQSLKLPITVPVCCQLWGDVDRSYFETKWIPEIEPEAGYMGLKLSTLGVEAVVRLQSGGLKVGQILSKAMREKKSIKEALNLSVRSGYAQYI